MRKQLLIVIALIICGFFAYLNYHHCIESADPALASNPESTDDSKKVKAGILPRKACRIKGFMYRDH